MLSVISTYKVLAQGPISRPFLSPNGQSVAWIQDVDGQQDVFVSSGGKTQRVTSSPENEGFALVSDDARTVAFTRRSADTNVWQLQVVQDGVEGVLGASRHHVQGATLSADGRRIAWEDHGQIRQGDPARAFSDDPAPPPDSSVPRQDGPVPLHGHGGRQQRPLLSGDGGLLLYQVSDLETDESHLVLEVDGREVGEIENNTNSSAALNFDGSLVVYPTTEEQGFFDLEMLDRRTGVSSIVSAQKDVDEAQPSVALNGHIAFQMTRYDNNAQPVRSLYLKTDAGLSEVVPSDPEWEPSLPQLSADGKTLLWLSSHRQQPEQRRICLAEIG